MGLAMIGIQNPDTLVWVATVGAAVVGSCISAGWRIMDGSIHGFKVGLLSVISGIPFALAAGHWIANIAGLIGAEAAFPIYLMSMMGAKATSYLSTKFDSGALIEALSKKITKEK